MVPALGPDPMAQGQLTETPAHFQTPCPWHKLQPPSLTLLWGSGAAGARVRAQEALPSVGFSLASTGLCWSGR